MSPYLTMIAISGVALAVGRLLAEPTIRRLRTQLADATWQAQHDPLTTLLNRAGLAAAFNQLQQTSPNVVLVLLDLDDFKTINDTHGHDGGDTVLTAVAGRIDEAAQLFGGISARLAGDEFVVVLPVRLGELCRRVELILNLIGQPVSINSEATIIRLEPRASAGVSLSRPGDTVHSLLHRADIALYQAKRHGGACVLHQPGMSMPDTPSRRGVRLRDHRWEGQ